MNCRVASPMKGTRFAPFPLHRPEFAGRPNCMRDNPQSPARRFNNDKNNVRLDPAIPP